MLRNSRGLLLLSAFSLLVSCGGETGKKPEADPGAAAAPVRKEEAKQEKPAAEKKVAPAEGKAPPPEEKVPPAETNLVLYVSNQSFKVDPIRIVISMDGRTVVDADFHVKNQHNWIRHDLALAKGKHRIVAKTGDGEGVLEREIETTDKHWAVIDFFAPHKDGVVVEKKFSFLFQDKPVYFR